jgi:hypothetical protein
MCSNKPYFATLEENVELKVWFEDCFKYHFYCNWQWLAFPQSGVGGVTDLDPSENPADVPGYFGRSSTGTVV